MVGIFGRRLSQLFNLPNPTPFHKLTGSPKFPVKQKSTWDHTGELDRPIPNISCKPGTRLTPLQLMCLLTLPDIQSDERQLNGLDPEVRLVFEIPFELSLRYIPNSLPEYPMDLP